MTRSTTVCAAALVLASFTGSGPMLTVAEAMPAPGPQPTQMRPRYYFPRHVKRDRSTSGSISTNTTAPATPTLSPSSSSLPSTLSSLSTSQEHIESRPMDFPSVVDSLFRNRPESSSVRPSSASPSLSSASASASASASSALEYALQQSDFLPSTLASSITFRSTTVPDARPPLSGTGNIPEPSVPVYPSSSFQPIVLPPTPLSLSPKPVANSSSSTSVSPGTSYSTSNGQSQGPSSGLPEIVVPASPIIRSSNRVSVVSVTASASPSADEPLDGLLPSFLKSAVAPTGLLPSSVIVGSTGLLPSVIVTPTQTPISSAVPSSPTMSSFQGPFIISGTGTGGASSPVIQPTTSHDLLGGLIPSLLAPLESTTTPEIGSTGRIPVSPILPTGSFMSTDGPRPLFPLPLPTGTGIMLGITAALSIGHSPSPTPTAPASGSGAIPTPESTPAHLDLPGKLSLVVSELSGIVGPPSLGSTAPAPTASLDGVLPPVLSSLLPDFPNLLSSLASGVPPVAFPTALSSIVADIESLLPTAPVPIVVPSTLPSNLVPSGILPTGILSSFEAVPSKVLSSLGALPSGVLPSGTLPSSLALSLALSDVLPSPVPSPTGISPSSAPSAGILPIAILPSSVPSPTGISPSSAPSAGILPIAILPSPVPSPTGISPSSVPSPAGILPSSVALPITILPSSVVLPTGVLPSLGILPSSIAVPVSVPPSSVSSPTGILPSGVLPSYEATPLSGGLPTGSLLPSIIPSSAAIPIPSETASAAPPILSGSINLKPSASAGISPLGSAVPSGSISVSGSPVPTFLASQSLSVPASEGLLSAHSSGHPSSATSTPPNPDYATISHAPTASIENSKSPSAYTPIPAAPSTASKPPLVISLSATATDSATSLVVGTSIVQEASSMPTPSASPTRSGIPSSLPRMIAPPGGVPTQISQDTFMGQVCFKWPLNYPFVSANDGGMQIFHYLPKAIADGLNIPQSEVRNLGLKPLDTTQYQGFITTLALFTIPSDLETKLAAQLRNPADVFWHNKDSTVNDLTSLINTACPLAVGSAPGQNSSPNGAADPASTSDGYGGDGGAMGGDIGASRKVNSTSAIVASGAIVGALAYGAAMFFVARRYRNKRIAHQRSSSVPSTSRMTYGSIPGGAAAWMHGARNGRMTPGSRGSQGSSASQGPSVRTQQISAPVMAENSLGWN